MCESFVRRVLVVVGHNLGDIGGIGGSSYEEWYMDVTVAKVRRGSVYVNRFHNITEGNQNQPDPKYW